MIIVTPTKIRGDFQCAGLRFQKTWADTLGNFPEQLATSFDENLAILHFDH